MNSDELNDLKASHSREVTQCSLDDHWVQAIQGAADDAVAEVGWQGCTQLW